MKVVHTNIGFGMYPAYRSISHFRTHCKHLSAKISEYFPNKRIGLVCMGSSGMAVAMGLSMCNENMFPIYVRKHDESSHSNVRVEHHDNANIFIFVDDLIATGRTMSECVNIFYRSSGHLVSGIAVLDSYVNYDVKEIDIDKLTGKVTEDAICFCT